MMDLTLARSYLKDRLPPDKVLTPEAMTRALVRAHQRIWRARPWRFSVKRSQISTTALYNTGGVLTLANGSTSVTFTGTALDSTHTDWYLRVGSEIRDYRIKSIDSATTATLYDPYEGSSIVASTSYTLAKKIYYLPGDYMAGFMFKESNSGLWLGMVPRHLFERAKAPGEITGQAWSVVEAGFSTAPMAVAGTVAVTAGSTTCTGTSTAFDSRMKGLEIRFDGFPYSFYIDSVTSTTALVLDRPWPFEAQALLTYKIAPEGSPLIELYPIHNYNGSIEIWYHRRPKDLAFGHDVPGWYPEYDDLWIDCALSQMGLMDEGLIEKRIGDFADRDGIERESVYQLGSGGDRPMTGPRPTGVSPAFTWW